MEKKIFSTTGVGATGYRGGKKQHTDQNLTHYTYISSKQPVGLSVK